MIPSNTLFFNIPKKTRKYVEILHIREFSLQNPKDRTK